MEVSDAVGEVVAFSDQVLRRGDAHLATLFTPTSSVIDGPLFDLYGVAKPAGFTAGQLVALDPTQRAGLLGLSTVTKFGTNDRGAGALPGLLA